MFEKNLTLGYLLDFYGDILSDQQRTVMNAYYNEDLSLAEIAEMRGISRQGVRHIIKKCEEELTELETKLGMAAQFQRIEKGRMKLLSVLDDADNALALSDISRLRDSLTDAKRIAEELGN